MNTLADVLAADFLERGVTTAFGVLGDGNLGWSAAFEARGGRAIQARHEGNAVAMAAGAARLTAPAGGVGVATVTCGPGLTHTATSLATAVRGRLPVIVLAGDVPSDPATPRDRAQAMDQQGFARALGAALVSVEDAASVLSAVAHAFDLATTGQPVILSCRSDLQRAHADPTVERPPAQAVANAEPLPPSAAHVEAIVERLRTAQRPFVLVGRGSVAAGAEAAACGLAERIGAPVGTTMPAKGHAGSDPWNAGVVGGYGTSLAARLADDTDLLIAVGASISAETLADGRLFPAASLVHVNLERPVTDRRWEDVLLVPADARLTAEAVNDGWDEGGLEKRIGRRTTSLAEEIADEPAREVSEEPWPDHAGTVDPRPAIMRIGAAAPPDSVFVSAVGHFSALPPRLIHGRTGQRWLMPYDFGAIGQSLSTGIGAAATSGRTTVVFEGDGGLLMNIQELDTARRLGLPMLVAVINDHALGAEYHQLLHDGMDPAMATVEPPSFTGVARSFGIEAMDVRQLDDLTALPARLAAGGGPLLLDVHVNPEARVRALRWNRGYVRLATPATGVEIDRL